MEQEQVRNLSLPDYSLLGRERPETDQGLANMQRLRGSAQEPVRWRSLRNEATDPDVAAVVSIMRQKAIENLYHYDL